MFVNNLQKFGFPLSPSLVGIKTWIHKFPVLIVDIVTKFGTIENFKVSVHYWSSLYRERNTEKQKNPLQSLWNPSKHYKNTSYTHKRTRKSILLFFPTFWTIFLRSLYSHTNSYINTVMQCHADSSQRSLGYLWSYWSRPIRRKIFLKSHATST